MSELDIATGIAYLKAYAAKHGKDAIPLAVQMSPFNPEEGWRRASIAFCSENARKRQAGEPVIFYGRPIGLSDVEPGPMMEALRGL